MKPTFIHNEFPEKFFRKSWVIKETSFYGQHLLPKIH